MSEPRKRHCWECRHLQLVCDSTQPSCKRCIASGTQCPGYGDVKPTRLRWLAAGTVKARPRRRAKPDQSRAVVASRTETNNQCSTESSASDAVAGQNPVKNFMPQLNAAATILAESTSYFNECIFRDLVHVNQLGRSPHIYSISTSHLRNAVDLPEYLQLGVVCMTLSHRITRIDNSSQSRELYRKLYQYRGIVLRSINEHLGNERHRSGDLLITGVMTLLLLDAQHGLSHDWRWHVQGIYKMIMLRGGFLALSNSFCLEPVLRHLWYIMVIGNTTCPTTQLIMTESHLDMLELMLAHTDRALSPFQLCPPVLFAEVAKINHLRSRAAQGDLAGIADHVQQCVRRIYSFSTEKWAATKPTSQNDWTLIGNTYQATVAIYCALSLGKISSTYEDTLAQTELGMQTTLLHALLAECVSTPHIERYMVWPLVVLGVAAGAAGAGGSQAIRDFVAAKLQDMSYRVGTQAPMTAKRVLETFWASGHTTWDACFDKPYAFTTQIAVDMSRLMPP